jgi:hypothetical protein
MGMKGIRTGRSRARTAAPLAATLLLRAAEPAAFASGAGQDLGCTPGLSRSQAMQVVTNMVITGSPHQNELVAFSYPTALTPGTLIEPYLDGGVGGTTVGTCSWFFYLDLTPELQFEHDTKFVLVSGSFAAPSLVNLDRKWWPVIDGLPVYDDPALNVVSPDLFFGSHPAFDVQCTLPADPPILTAPDPRLWGIRLLGPRKWDKDVKVAKDALGKSGGVSPGNNKRWAFNQASIADAVQEANDAMASCVYVYITTHGSQTPPALSSRLRNDEGITPAELADLLDDLRACSVIVLIDACFSGAFADPLLDALKNRPLPLIPHPTAICAVLTSASSTKESLYHDGLPCPGSYWTQALAACWADPRADTFDDGIVTVFEAFDWVLAQGCDKAKVGDPQIVAITGLCEADPALMTTMPGWGSLALGGLLAAAGALLIRRRFAA